jgi:hypothetical protein
MCWLDVLQRQCQGRQIAEVASELGYSRGAISMALHGKYPGDTKHIQAAVERMYPSDTVSCPVLGELDRDQCQFHQSRPMGGAPGGARMRLYLSCKSCPNRCEKECE